MEVSKEFGKTKIVKKKLYHIQAFLREGENIIDYFIWSKDFPKKEKVKKFIQRDFPKAEDKEWVDQIIDKATIYCLYAEEL